MQRVFRIIRRSLSNTQLKLLFFSLCVDQAFLFAVIYMIVSVQRFIRIDCYGAVESGSVKSDDFLITVNLRVK